MACLQSEFCTKDFFRATNFLPKNAPKFSPKFLSLCSVGQKKIPGKFPPNFPLNFPNFPAKNLKKNSPTSLCRSAGRRNRRMLQETLSTPECPKSVPRVSPQRLGHLLTLRGHSPWGTLSCFAPSPTIREAPDTFNFLRHVMRAIWSVRPNCSHRRVSQKETPLKPVQSLKHTTENSAEQTVMRTKWFKHIAI